MNAVKSSLIVIQEIKVKIKVNVFDYFVVVVYWKKQITEIFYSRKEMDF